MRPGRLRTSIFAAAAVVAVVLAASAVAYWAGPGQGSAQTRLGDPLALALGPGTPSAQLYPGDDASVAVIATNPNPYTVHIESIALDPDAGTAGFDVDAAHDGCDLSPIAFATQDNGGAGWTVPPRTGDTDGALPIDLAAAMTMDATASNACQGATFTVHLEVGA